MSTGNIVLLVAIVVGYLTLKRVTDLLVEIRNLLDRQVQQTRLPSTGPHFKQVPE